MDLSFIFHKQNFKSKLIFRKTTPSINQKRTKQSSRKTLNLPLKFERYLLEDPKHMSSETAVFGIAANVKSTLLLFIVSRFIKIAP